MAVGPGPVAQMTRAHAEAVTAAIVGHLEDAVALIIDAYAGRAWVALGDPSWDAYCRSRLQVSVPREHRAAVAVAMRTAGMSPRAVASATGWSEAVVRTDIKGTDAALADVIGIDGKRYPVAARRDTALATERAEVPKTQRAVMLLLEVGARGLTADELGGRMLKAKAPGAWHWGATSGLLSKLEDQQRAVRNGEARGRHAVYVHPAHAEL